MTNLETYIHLSNEVNSAKLELSSFINGKQFDIMLEIAKKLKTFHGMNKMIIKGYTPGFNDGDACVHNSYAYFNKRYDFSEIAQDDVPELAKFLNVPEDFEDEIWEWSDINSINDYEDSDEDEINDLANLLNELIENIYGTDYIVFIDLTTDEPTITHHDYYCGY